MRRRFRRNLSRQGETSLVSRPRVGLPLTQERVRRYTPPIAVTPPVRSVGRVSTVSRFLSDPARSVRIFSAPRPVRRSSNRINRVMQVIRASVEQQRRPGEICRQRSQRREVIFAAGVGGRRGSAPGPYRRSIGSEVSC